MYALASLYSLVWSYTPTLLLSISPPLYHRFFVPSAFSIHQQSPSPNILLAIPPSPPQSYLQPHGYSVIPRSNGIPLPFYMHVHDTKQDIWCPWPAGWRFSHVKQYVQCKGRFACTEGPRALIMASGCMNGGAGAGLNIPSE